MLIIHAENLALRTFIEEYEFANYGFNFVHRNFPLGFSKISGVTMFAYAVPENVNTSSEADYAQ